MKVIEPDSYFPSPTISALSLGPVTINFYALCILAGIIVAVWLTGRRLDARGGQPGQVLDVVTWAVPFGIIGGRLYHVITDYQLYFGPGKNPLDALKIWEGGLGIWGAIALGALGAYIGCRRNNVNFLAFADSAAPAILIAQALGRWGNWFNNELYGDPSTAPWALQIHTIDPATNRAKLGADGAPVVLGYFEPTFLYESLWCLAAATLILILDKKTTLGAGSVLALYVALYTAGRFFFELMRSDYANLILGLRINTWVSAILFLAATTLFLRRKNRPRSTTHRTELKNSPQDARALSPQQTDTTGPHGR
ncbi:prolipoprotein diacylglyceryl transferase [Arthrobacter echini]|uniref:Phosphatidylglycerol--prolipoprotein diacylglyceryl transferase n=2 Tax=Arthrobacter echini TaxID=1529066 RepID=A0A4S5E0J4_9MICC|nr:prolipoprotein diacylglyceryl transferase [Arthrobacter echini]THJ64800.1 prolipoprotein diacylglyceryl transferase [Arthrobacter echini]TYC97141.1 prolipoprotein diacylglyceryl transferase [Arthrobacter echini]